MTARVLIVDDDEPFARMLAMALRRRGFAVEAIHAEHELSPALDAGEFDFILLDLMLGEISTIVHIPGICERQPAAKLIMLTGYASIPATVQAVRAGAINLLAKPVGVNEVLAALQQAGHDGLAQGAPDDTGRMGIRQIEWEHIQRVLADHEGNISAAARAMGMHRRTLQRKLMKKAPIR